MMAQFTSGFCRSEIKVSWVDSLARSFLKLGLRIVLEEIALPIPRTHQSPILISAGWSFFAADWLLVGRGVTPLGFQSLSGLCGCPCAWAAEITYFSCLKSLSCHLLPYAFCFQPKALGCQPVAPQWLPSCEDMLCHHRVFLPPIWHEQLPLFCG